MFPPFRPLLLQGVCLVTDTLKQAQTGLIQASGGAARTTEDEASNPMSYDQNQIEIENLIIPELIEMHTKMIEKAEAAAAAK
jgi:hypothetical protein